MRHPAPTERTGKILLWIGVAVTAFLALSAYLSVKVGGDFSGMLTVGLWVMAGYALAGGVTALIAVIRTSNARRHRSG